MEVPPTAFIMEWRSGRGDIRDDAVARCVGISSLTFCNVIGQPRAYRNSSGAMSFVLTQPPASRAITSIPACASGNAATPPAAPAPMMTTFVFLRLMAMVGISPQVEQIPLLEKEGWLRHQ